MLTENKFVGKEVFMNTELMKILKSGEIKDKRQAEMFAEAAEWNLWDETAGDFRLKVEDGYAEIYGSEIKTGDETVAVPKFPQKIRFFDSEMDEISFVPEPKLKTLREDAGLSQSQLAEKSGVAIKSIQKYEQRERDINKAQGVIIKSLAGALECTMEDILD